MKILTTILLMCLFTLIEGGASDIHKAPDKSLKKELAFRQFLKKFQLLSLPLTIQVSGDVPKGFPSIRENSIDTFFIKSGADSTYSSICYGLLPDTSKYFMLIWEYPANLYEPILTTFTKDGNKVFETSLGEGDCAGNEMVAGSGICTECINTVLIRKDYSIYSSDTITTQKCESDSIGITMEGTSQRQLTFTNGKINKNGTAVFTQQQKKDLP